MSDTQTHKRMFFREALAKAVREEMTSNPRVFIMGQDVGALAPSASATRP